jgi:hypothetical protein
MSFLEKFTCSYVVQPTTENILKSRKVVISKKGLYIFPFNFDFESALIKSTFYQIQGQTYWVMEIHPDIDFAYLVRNIPRIPENEYRY